MDIKSQFFLIVLLSTCVYCLIGNRYRPYPYYPPSKRQIYGNIEGVERIGYQHERRWGFPFFTREALIIFPSVLFSSIEFTNFSSRNLVIFTGIHNWFTVRLHLFHKRYRTWKSAWWRRLFAKIGNNWRRNIRSKHDDEDNILFGLRNKLQSVDIWG